MHGHHSVLSGDWRKGVKAAEPDEYPHAGPRDFAGGHRKCGANLAADCEFFREEANFFHKGE
jgi:hypothetical protein